MYFINELCIIIIIFYLDHFYIEVYYIIVLY